MQLNLPTPAQSRKNLQALSCLSLIFDYALDKDLCIKNPYTKNIRLPSGTVEKWEVFSDAEIEILERFALIDCTFGPAIMLLIFAGLCSGEVPPFFCRDIDKDANLWGFSL